MIAVYFKYKMTHLYHLENHCEAYQICDFRVCNFVLNDK